MLCRLLFCSALVLLFTGCDVKPDTCKDQSSWSMKIGFYGVTLTGDKRTVSDMPLTILSIKLGSENIWGTTKGSKAAMYLFQDKDSMTFSFTINKKDTVTLTSANLNVIYKTDKIFENYKCGFRTNFILDKVYSDHKIFDSIIIVQPYITDVYQENIRFYLNDSIK